MDVFFLEGSKGPIFATHHPAAGTRHRRFGLVYVPPFAEEMNRVRRMAALQARSLAKLGVDVLLLDPFGTGDSAGEFGDARWDTWRDDVGTAIAWLDSRTDTQVGLWGARLGALLAADVAAMQPERITRLILWQPVLDGDRYLTQFLRLRVAATMDAGADRETTKELRARLSRGMPIEIAGYELAPELADSISSRQLQTCMERLDGLPISWLEVAGQDEAALTPQSQQVVNGLRERGHQLATIAVRGEPFWATQEITLAPNLLQATDDLFRG
jgi:exosortase A-associated hydrolase 2